MIYNGAEGPLSKAHASTYTIYSAHMHTWEKEKNLYKQPSIHISMEFIQLIIYIIIPLSLTFPFVLCFRSCAL